jgi:RHS repeat-associated protein
VSCANLAFGDGNTCSADTTSHIHFTGQYQDDSSGLDNLKARYYSPMLGRFMTPDPAGLAAVNPNDPQTWNQYAYVGNSPLGATDPSGLRTVKCLFATTRLGQSSGCNAGMYGGGGGDIWLDGAEVGSIFGSLLDTPDSSYTGVCLSLFACSEDTASEQAAEAFVNDIPTSVGPPNQQQIAQCVSNVVGAVNTTFNTSFTTAEAIGVYDASGGEVNVDISGDVTQVQFSEIGPGRYAPNLSTEITGFGPSLHIPSGPSSIDPTATPFQGSSGGGTYTVSFTAHLDSDYATWHSPLGVLTHYYTDVLGSATRNYCPAY